MRVLFMLVMLVTLMGCSKYTTPRKVNNKLTDGAWMIYDFVDNGKSISSRYKNFTIAFGKDNGISVNTTANGTVAGTWTVGTQRDPAVIYMNLPDVDSLLVFADDWVVYKLNKTECVLKRNQGKVGEKDETDYEGSADNLTLVKK